MSDFIDFGETIFRKDCIISVQCYRENGKFKFRIDLDKSKSDRDWYIWTFDSKEDIDVYMNYAKAFLGLPYDKESVKGSEND